MVLLLAFAGAEADVRSLSAEFREAGVMETLLAQLLYFLRPVLFIETDISVAGLGGFALFNGLYFAPLLLLGLMVLGKSNALQLSRIEKLLLLYVGWGVLVALFFSPNASADGFIKLLAPLVSYLIFRRLISSKRLFVRALQTMLVGFAPPVFASAWLIRHRQGNVDVDFFSGVERFSGVYSQIHPMGHSMGLVLMLTVLLYAVASSPAGGRVGISRVFWLYLMLLWLGAFYCMFHSHVRTVYLGLLIFFPIVCWSLGKRYLLLLVVAGGLMASTQTEMIRLVFMDVIDAVEGRDSIEKAGSGRLLIWGDKLTDFAETPLDRQLVGKGLGGHFVESDSHWGALQSNEVQFDSHNDYLHVLIDYGIIGLLLLILLYSAVWNQIGRLVGLERAVFRGFFLAVLVMNLVSNSYVSRFGLAQILFMVLIYLDQAPVYYRRYGLAQQRMRARSRKPMLSAGPIG
ncbi:MAG TPA: hypothetical protein DCF45_07555 [Gammaproteobacteria bacterium]|nr:hypothetical protein [Gammaproteobacteria bacterium]